MVWKKNKNKNNKKNHKVYYGLDNDSECQIQASHKIQ